MYDTEHTLRPPAPQSDNATLFVSLYVVLLAFFIMLNVISERDDKRRQEVIDSVNETFTVPEKLQTEKLGSEAGNLPAIEQFYGELEDTLETLVEFDEVKVIRTGNTLVITMPTRLLFKDGSAVIRPISLPFMQGLTALLTKWQHELGIELEFLIGYNGTLTGGSETEARLEALRAGKFARFLEENSVNTKALAIGMRENYPGVILLTFNLHDPNPRNPEESYINSSKPEKSANE